MSRSRPRKSASGSWSWNVDPLPVGHHSGGCESGVKISTSRLGTAVCAPTSR
jgi:hypothetical protein